MGDQLAFATLFAAASLQEHRRWVRWLFLVTSAAYALGAIEAGLIVLPAFLARHVHG